MRAMALAIIQKQFERTGNPKRDAVRDRPQGRCRSGSSRPRGATAAWNYDSRHGGPGRLRLLEHPDGHPGPLAGATRPASRSPTVVWQRPQAPLLQAPARRRVLELRRPDERPWTATDSPGYGSMTAAGLASVYIIGDMLDLASGCPCRDGKSSRRRGPRLNRRVDLALGWLSQGVRADQSEPRQRRRVAVLLAVLRPSAWAWPPGTSTSAPTTGTTRGPSTSSPRRTPTGPGTTATSPTPASPCSSSTRAARRSCTRNSTAAPSVEWNNHRRDLANLTAYIERTKEQPFQWQIVEPAGAAGGTARRPDPVHLGRDAAGVHGRREEETPRASPTPAARSSWRPPAATRRCASGSRSSPRRSGPSGPSSPWGPTTRRSSTRTR